MKVIDYFHVKNTKINIFGNPQKRQKFIKSDVKNNEIICWEMFPKEKKRESDAIWSKTTSKECV